MTSRAAAMANCLALGGGWSEVVSIVAIACDFERMWPVE